MKEVQVDNNNQVILNFDITSNFNAYQFYARQTAIYPNKNKDLTYVSLGVAGEAGEICEKIKKVIRDKNGIVDEQTKKEISKEIGDEIWYLANLASELGLNLQDIAKENLIKLYDRMARNKLQGSGDNR